MFPLNLEAKLIAGALALLALAGAFCWVVHDIRAAEDLKFALAAAAADAKNHAETQRRESQQKENLREADAFNAQYKADARDVADLGQRVRLAASSGRLAPRDSAAACASNAASVPAPAVVSADVFSGVERMAEEATAYADCLNGTSELCAKNYHALTP